MKQTPNTVHNLLAQLKDITRRVTAKDSTLKPQDTDLCFHQIMYKLASCAPACLNKTSGLDALLEAAPEFEAYRGKGMQTINDGYPKIFKSILMEIEYGPLSSSASPAAYTKKSVHSALQKIAPFALERAQGDGKPIRSQRAARMRQTYWELLTDISEYFSFAEALDLAKNVARNAKASIPERRGALGYLLTHLSLENDQPEQDCDSKKDNTEIKSIVATIRENPPNRDILFLILDAEVNSGEIDQMAALFDLEDWDEANEN